MRFKIKIKSESNPEGWWEEYGKAEVHNLEEAKKWGMNIVKYFNSTLREGEKPREFIAARLEESRFVSNCCGAPPVGEIIDGEAFCSRCQDHAFFEEDED